MDGKSANPKPLAEPLVGEGFAPNEFLLETNRTLQSDAADPGEPWNLPSRLMRFPLEVQRFKGQLRIGLMHPLPRGHPFVQRVAEATRWTRSAATARPTMPATPRRLRDLRCCWRMRDDGAAAHLDRRDLLVGRSARSRRDHRRAGLANSRLRLCSMIPSRPGTGAPGSWRMMRCGEQRRMMQ
jgi:hypothetical protein